ESARRVYPVDIDTVRARVSTIIREARSGRHCFYEQARDRFMWPSERSDDLLFPVIQQLQADGLITLGAAGGSMTVAMTVVESLAEPEGAEAPLPWLSGMD